MTLTPDSRWIRVDTAGGSFDAYLSLPPAGKQPGSPGIVLVQEIFGVNAHIRAVADQYAADGYVVLSPDLFWRSQPRVELGYDGPDWERAMVLRKAVNLEDAVADIGATAAALRNEIGEGGKLAAVGYCFGGLLSYLAAARGMVDAAVPYYGGGIQNQLHEAAALNVPVQFHYGALDAHITPEDVENVRQAVAGKRGTEVFVYDQADHGFNCWSRASYHQRAAALAHGRTLTFLANALS
ncbi:dienelactone hydrolase family protein [Cupriavidus agavae]|uniref:Carboxymethylenebutenolidase n=1 Tax=Cupriavidus agavae TaxID=1001822 RepID=A0A4Q7RCJ7_9BURK|nr:dienelactone hydrolase family protein [Cupriavidus agavae]RZT29362.1 carboxymethylenebutenolidase [Cupriavidus agavae]